VIKIYQIYWIQICLMSRINNIFKKAQVKIAYLTADVNSVDYFLALIKGGVDILEIGIPFSDPVADGVVIQKAMNVALNNHTNISIVFDIVKQIRAKSDVGIILFTYYNPIVHNLNSFLTQAKDSGADGILVVDLPYEESFELNRLCAIIGLCNIYVAAPSTSLARVKLLSEASNGFLYYACRKGTTGAKNDLPDDVIKRIQEVKNNSALPVAVGFGVSNNLMVQQIFAVAQACVVGSYFVNAVNNKIPALQLQQMVESLFKC
jgi:tryptophan synthase alpha chain